MKTKDMPGEKEGTALRRQVEEGPCDPEPNYWDLFSEVPVGLFRITPEGRVMDANSALVEILGYPNRESVLAINALDLCADPMQREQLLDRLTREGVVHDFEIRGRRHDGTTIWVLTNVRAVKDADGRVLHYEGSLGDISKRRKAEEELKIYHDHLEEMLEERTAELQTANEQLRQEILVHERTEEQISRQTMTLDGIYRVLRETLTCESDEEVARACLAVAEELTGSKFGIIGELNQTGLFDTIAITDTGWEACRMPESDALVKIKDMEIRGIWSRVLKDERSLVVNDPASHPHSVGVPEGHPPLACFLGVPLKRAGKTIGMIGLANKEQGYDEDDLETVEALSGIFVEALHHVRAQQAFEQLSHKYELILTSAGEGIYGVDIHGNTTFANAAALSMTGFETHDLIGRHQHDILHHTKQDGTPYPREECPVHLAIRDGAVRQIPGEVFWKKDGTSFPVEYVAAPIRERDEVVGSVVVFKDVTQRKKRERVIRKEKEKRKNLVINTSHLLNTPLTVVRGNLELVKVGSKELTSEMCEKLIGRLNEMERLIRGELYEKIELLTVETSDGFTPMRKY